MARKNTSAVGAHTHPLTGDDLDRLVDADAIAQADVETADVAEDDGDDG